MITFEKRLLHHAPPEPKALPPLLLHLSHHLGDSLDLVAQANVVINRPTHSLLGSLNSSCLQATEHLSPPLLLYPSPEADVHTCAPAHVCACAWRRRGRLLNHLLRLPSVPPPYIQIPSRSLHLSKTVDLPCPP